MGDLGRLLLILPALVALFWALGWVLFPLERVVVRGNESLSDAAVARLAGAYPGAPWLYLPRPARARLLAHPNIQSAEVKRLSFGVLLIEVKERSPRASWQGMLGFPGNDRLAVVIDAEGNPLLESEAPTRIAGPEGRLDEALFLLSRYPSATNITFGPAGYTLEFGERRIWLADPETPAPDPPRGHVYAWGVSVGP